MLPRDLLHKKLLDPKWSPAIYITSLVTLLLGLITEMPFVSSAQGILIYIYKYHIGNTSSILNHAILTVSSTFYYNLRQPLHVKG